MSIHFSKQCGFQIDGIHKVIHADAIEIGTLQYDNLLEQQSQGHTIDIVDGQVVAVPPPALVFAQRRRSYHERATAYLNAQAVCMGFTSFRDALTFLDDDNPKYAAAALALKKWRSKYLTEFDRIFEEEQPTDVTAEAIDTFIKRLPPFNQENHNGH